MSATQLHLALNHLPLFGSAIAIVLFGWALLARSRDLTKAALVLTFVCGIAGFAAKLSGEEAEEQGDAVAIATDRMGTHASNRGEVVTEEHRQRGGPRHSGATSSLRQITTIARDPMCFSSHMTLGTP